PSPATPLPPPTWSTESSSSSLLQEAAKIRSSARAASTSPLRYQRSPGNTARVGTGVPSTSLVALAVAQGRPSLRFPLRRWSFVVGPSLFPTFRKPRKEGRPRTKRGPHSPSADSRADFSRSCLLVVWVVVPAVGG